jgi:uncharacterized phage protein gp47/JayE
MTIETLPTTVGLPTRNELIEKYLARRRVRNPGIDTSRNSEAWIDAIVATDTHLQLFAEAQRMGQNTVVTDSRGAATIKWGQIENVPRPEASGSTGYIQISTSAGLWPIPEGDPLHILNNPAGPRFRVRVGNDYGDESWVPIEAIDTGVETNLPTGTVLRFERSRPGVGDDAPVVALDGDTGLSGGRDSGTDFDHIEAILSERQNKQGSGNQNEYIGKMKRTPGVAVQQGFIYPALLGSGIVACCFTVMPNRYGGSRRATTDQITVVRNNLLGPFPADDDPLVMAMLGQDVTLAYSVKWADNAEGWTDSQPWPDYQAEAANRIIVSAVTSPTEFEIAVEEGSDYSVAGAPAAGTTLGLFDAANSRFVVKRVKTVTGSGPFAIVCDNQLSASDVTFTPVVGQRVMPWSNSLPLLVDGLVTLFKSLGPGELTTVLYDDGVRRRRHPLPPTAWPHRLTERMLEDAIAISAVADRESLEGDGTATDIGSPAVFAYLLELGDVAIYKKS